MYIPPFTPCGAIRVAVAPYGLLDAYPHLAAEDIQAAMTYAADTLAHEETLLVEPKA